MYTVKIYTHNFKVKKTPYQVVVHKVRVAPATEVTVTVAVAATKAATSNKPITQQ